MMRFRFKEGSGAFFAPFSLRLICYVLIVLGALVSLSWHAGAEIKHTKSVVLIKVESAIGPAVQDHVTRGLQHAEKSEAELVVLQLDTPGGLGKSMRGIVSGILASPVPVVTYVGPSGARAASAGTFILYASHVAVMAPGTHVGAASPVAITSPGVAQPDKKSETKSQADTLKEKATNDASAYIRSLAQLRGRNEVWAESAVRQAKSLSAKEAVQKNVIDLIAKDLPTLLKTLHGREVSVKGEKRVLSTQGLPVTEYKPDWRVRFLAVVTDPNVAYILLLIGMYGLFFEFANPGFVLPGVVGAISLLIAVYALQLLPVNYVGLALIFLGVAFMVAEAFLPSFGALGIGGVVAFIFGSILLLDTTVPGYAIAMPLILTIAAVTAGFFLVVINMALRARFRPVVSGSEEMLGIVGRVIKNGHSAPQVRVHGELWQVRSEVPLERGQCVKVVGREGLILEVKPVKED